MLIINKIIKNGAAVFERIPYAQQSGLSKGSEVLCASSIICGGCPRTESETRQIFDTSDLEGEGRIQRVIKMTIGVKRRTHEKVQYCITAMRIEKDAILKWHPYDLPRECTADVYLVGGARGEDFALNDIPHPDYV